MVLPFLCALSASVCTLLELAPCTAVPVAGLHRASPSTTLDKVFSSAEIIQNFFFSVNRYFYHKSIISGMVPTLRMVVNATAPTAISRARGVE